MMRCASSNIERRPFVSHHRCSLGVHNRSSVCRRYLSAASASKKRKPSKRKKHPPAVQLDESPPSQQKVPKWAATASVLIIPFVFASWGASDWMFGNRTKGHNEGLRQEFLAEQQEQSRGNDAETYSDGWLALLDGKPTLFHCVIRKNSGLTHCLSGVQLGDVVEVLEEGVGPEKAYNLCRLPAKEETAGQSSLSRDTYGWFPIRWLQKLEHYESMAREQQTNILSRSNPE